MHNTNEPVPAPVHLLVGHEPKSIKEKFGYYIIYTWNRQSIGAFDKLTGMESWSIVISNHDLDSVRGLDFFIKERSVGKNNFILREWRKLVL